MPSSYTTSLRFELQFTGEGTNVWGDRNNGVITRIESSIAGWTTKALTGNYTLTTANGSADEARSAMLKFTGSGPFTVTIPSVSKSYLIWNACTADLTISTGAGTTVTLATGDKRLVFSDGSSVYELGFGGSSLKSYIDNLAWTYNAGALPAQAGNSGKVLTTDGTTGAWSNSLGSLTMTGLVVNGPTRQSVTAVSASAIDLTLGDYFTKSISSNTTFSFTNAGSGAIGFILDLTISSSAVPSWPASVKWSDGANPSSTLGNGRHIIGFFTTDSGTTWVGVLGATAVA